MNGKYTKALSMIVIALMMLSIFAVFPIKAQGAGYADIYVNPSIKHITKPPYVLYDEIQVEVRVANYTQVAGYQVKLWYDMSLLNVSAPAKVQYAPDGDHIFPYAAFNPVAASIGDNGTHQYIMKTATTIGAVEYSGSDAGLVVINFTIMSVPPKGSTYSCPLWLEDTDTYTMDENLDDNGETLYDGLYEIEGILVKPYLQMDPASVTKPDIPGDRIVGTSRAIFNWNILIKDVDALHDIIIAQWSLYYNDTLLDVTDVMEGTFMNDTTWAKYGTMLGWVKDPGRISGFILINPNETTGEWDWPERPEGQGLFAIIEFEAIYQEPNAWTASCPVNLAGVFGEFFLNTSIEYVPYADPQNGTYTINGYAWANPIAAFTWSPPTPLVGSPVLFDGSTSVGFQNVLGVLVPTLAYLKEFTWNFGDGNITVIGDDEPFTPTITHAYAAMGEYTVTLTVKDLDNRIDTESKTVSIVFGRLIDVFTQYDPPYGGQGINATSDMFWPQKRVILTAILTYNGDAVQHKPVAFQIVSPTGMWNFTRVEFTDADGIAIIHFNLPWPCDYPEGVVFGIWTVIAKADIQCVTTEDWLWFKVYWYTHNLTVTPKETEYHKTEMACFDIVFLSYSAQARWVLITVTVYDDLDVPIGQASTWILVGNPDLKWCMYTRYNLTLCVYIPKYAFVGTGKVYVNSFFNWPMECGYALSPEARATFKILKAI